jgi:hypothetical protein
MPGLLAIAKVGPDQFKNAKVGFVENCFLCTPQYIFEHGRHIYYGINASTRILSRPLLML